MELKYIEGTNKQYSIREDGILIRHYNINKNNKEKNYNDTEIHGSTDKRKNRTSITFGWRINGKRIYRTQGSLLVEYFGYKICKLNKCNNKVYDKNCYHCSSCVNNNVKQLHKDITRNSINNISKHYVATKLGIKISELTDELYSLYKANLKTKRLISNKTGKHFNTKYYESTKKLSRVN